MTRVPPIRIPLLAALAALLCVGTYCQSNTSLDAAHTNSSTTVTQDSQHLESSIRTEMDFLASDKLQGRGSATHDEYLAAEYAAAQFQAMGLKPGAKDGSYLQHVPLPQTLPPLARRLLANLDHTPRVATTNVIAILPGSDPALRNQVILLTAHLDHLGMAAEKSGDYIYHGADDDASGCIAVMELARNLAAGPAPRRTVIFALFGSEELGGLGNAGFLDHPPIPLKNIVANLEFEMIGWPDPAIATGKLWLSGYDRSNFGATLAQHGAPLVPDPHTRESFFQRSDNYGLAQRGIIAHTVSSFGLQPEYHTPADDISHIDFPLMTHSILAIEPPIQWLANTDWKPKWNPGGKP